jgi:hypothetical protein
MGTVTDFLKKYLDWGFLASKFKLFSLALIVSPLGKLSR